MDDDEKHEHKPKLDKKLHGKVYHTALRNLGRHQGRTVVAYKVYETENLAGSPVLVGVAYEKKVDRRITEQLELLHTELD